MDRLILKPAHLEKRHDISVNNRFFDIRHGYRTARYAACIGLVMGLSSMEISVLCNAALFHDFGKLSLPQTLVNKPGILTVTERKTLSTHTRLGADLLTQSDEKIFNMAGLVALTHHERWNGKGYPYGISGTSIPLYSRITAIADVFDALTSRRSYKPVWSASEAIRFIKQRGGEHFDPHLIEQFHSALPNILYIYGQGSAEITRVLS